MQERIKEHDRDIQLSRTQTSQARNQRGIVHGVRSHPPTGPKGPHFDTQCLS